MIREVKNEPSDDELMQEFRKLLEDETNRDILSILSEHNSLPAGDIVKRLNTSANTGMMHILELKKAGLLEKTVNPPNYNLDKEIFALVKEQFNDLF